jgi:hypothetical protein
MPLNDRSPMPPHPRYSDALTTECIIIKMAAALKPLPRLDDASARVARYIAADIPSDCIRDYDREAIKREKMRRETFGTLKDIAALIALGIGGYAALCADPTQAMAATVSTDGGNLGFVGDFILTSLITSGLFLFAWARIGRAYPRSEAEQADDDRDQAEQCLRRIRYEALSQ